MTFVPSGKSIKPWCVIFHLPSPSMVNQEASCGDGGAQDCSLKW